MKKTCLLDYVSFNRSLAFISQINVQNQTDSSSLYLLCPTRHMFSKVQDYNMTYQVQGRSKHLQIKPSLAVGRGRGDELSKRGS